MEGCEFFREDHDIKNEKGEDKKGGGVLLYVNSKFNPIDRDDFENSSFNLRNISGLTYMLEIKKVGWCLL